MNKIGILVAMEEELLPALKTFGEAKEIQTYCKKPVYIIKNGGKSLYVVSSGVGEIAAAATAQMLIDRYGVDTIINFGFAGALKPQFKLGEIVVVRGVVHYDYDISALENVPRGRYTENEEIILPISANLAEQAQKIGGLRTALVASGDKVIADKKVAAELISEFGVDICEMEAAGIALTAKRNGGVDVLLIKLISDNADENMDVDFGKAVANGTVACGKLITSLLSLAD